VRANGTPSDPELIEKAKRARNGDQFARLWAGDISDYGDDESRADLALCGLLAFWTGPDPTRIDTLFRQSGLMREKWERKDYRERTIKKALEGHTEFYNSPNGHHDTAVPPRSAKRPSDSPRKPKGRTLEPYQPFPLQALPQPLAEYAHQASLALGCDPAYLALPILSVAAAAIGNTRAIRLKPSWEEPSVIWSVIVGDSGTLKSPAYIKAVAHLFRLQKRLLEDYKREQAQYQEDLEAHKERKRRAKDGGPAPGEPPSEPVRQRVVCSDTTIEKLAEILEDNPRGLLVARDELSGWIGSFTRYKSQGGTDLPNWLEMHRAGTVVVDRKTGERPTLFVPRAAASVTGGIQPGVLTRALAPEILEAGLAARLLMVMPPKRPKRWSKLEVSSDTVQAYENVLDRLFALDFARNCEGERAPRVLTLSPEADAVWGSFYDTWSDEQNAVEGELVDHPRSVGGRPAALLAVHPNHDLFRHEARADEESVELSHPSEKRGPPRVHTFKARAIDVR
jgi:hypothetical protein